MAEYCLDCFLKQNPDIPREKLGITKDFTLCEGCGQHKQVVWIKVGFFKRVKNRIESWIWSWRERNN